MKNLPDFILSFVVTALGFFFVPSLLSGFTLAALPITLPLMLVVPWVPVAVLILFGLSKRRPGLALAPLAFLGLWLATAVWMRHDVQADVPSDLLDREVPEAARQQRTLIVPQFGFDISLLANGQVDRIVYYSVNQSTGRIKILHSYRLGKGAECSAQPPGFTKRLWEVGRLDECILRDEPTTMPAEGLLLRWDRQYNPNGLGCCNELTFLLLEDGKEQKIGAWRMGHAGVLAYWPMMVSFPRRRESNHRISVWGLQLASPIRRVALGAPAFKLEDVLNAIYDGAYKAPIKAAGRSPEEILAAAYARLPQAIGTPEKCEALRRSVRLVQERGLVDTRSFEIMATVVGGFSNIRYRDRAASGFAVNLSPQDSRRFADAMLAFMGDPAIAHSYWGTDFNSSYVLSGEEALARSLEVFRSGTDLGAWQYEAAARIYMYMPNEPATTSMEYSPETKERLPDRARALFDVLRNDRSPDFSARARALCRSLDKLRLITDEERSYIARNLDRIVDRDYDRILTDRCLRHGGTQADSDIRRLVRERAERVADPDLRRRIEKNLPK